MIADTAHGSEAAEEQLRAHVRTALAAARISQAEAARRLGVSAKHMSHLMTGRAPLTLGWAERILALCGKRVVVTVRRRRPALAHCTRKDQTL